jgi:hypothetical protein
MMEDTLDMLDDESIEEDAEEEVEKILQEIIQGKIKEIMYRYDIDLFVRKTRSSIYGKNTSSGKCERCNNVFIPTHV